MAEHRNSNSFQDSSLLPPAPIKSNLPKLRLPQFSGKYSEFPNFNSTFAKLVDSDQTLTPIEKFNHLLNCLSGAALQAVQAFEVSEANYAKAYAQLKERYDNKYLTFQEHIVGLLHLPKVAKSSPGQLRLLVDSTNAHLSALRSLGTSENILDALIIHLVNAKLDSDSIDKLEESVEHSRLPSWEECSKVLNKRCQFLEARDNRAEFKAESSPSQPVRKKKGPSSSTVLTAAKSACPICEGVDHLIYKCPRFLELPVLARFKQIKDKGLCINCLFAGHNVKRCSSSKCKVCSLSHHTLLHRNNVDHSASSACERVSRSNQNGQRPLPSENSLTTSLVSNESVKSQVFLASAVVKVRDKAGQYHFARALLDSASQLNFISEDLAQTLKLPRSKAELTVNGIGNSSSSLRWSTQVYVKSRTSDFETDLSCYVLPHITGLQPERRVETAGWQLPLNIQLADPQFYKPQRIDLLIGADVFFHLLCVGQIRLQDNLPTLQKTVLGWIVSGRYLQSPSTFSTLTSQALAMQESGVGDVTEELRLSQLVQKFWEEESIPESPAKLNEEHSQCEAEFERWTRRLPDGRFMVKLPFRKFPVTFPGTLDIARRRFYNLERRLGKDAALKRGYSEFLKEYLSAGHMESIDIERLPQAYYFLPHSCVLRPDSSTTKLRVVFDASCRAASGKSLNDMLLVGPNIQDDLFSILSRFRCYRFALTADITAMYRQVLVYPEDGFFQLILWRESPADVLQAFRLKTVTYGTAPASFLATRCLRRLAEDFRSKLPRASEIVHRDFYMDDLLTGADCQNELYQIRKEVDLIVKSGQFILRKWYSNDMELLSQIPEAEREKTLRINDCEVVKTLGIIWDPTADEFQFHYTTSGNSSSSVTKRTILSDVARLFDPLGLVNPVVVRAKIFLQELWLLKLDWDESLPQDLDFRWRQFKSQLNTLNHLKIPRRVLGGGRPVKVSLHGFADASTRAFGCCIYVLSIDGTGNVSASLVAAKSKVAPVKTPRTVACLELCAAVLLARLFEKVRRNFPKPLDEQYLWTDSEIVLDWLSAQASNWKVYVANRVSEIQRLTEDASWRFVNSAANPADIVSRGIPAEELVGSIWFSGPEFLRLPKENWPPQRDRHLNLDDIPERRKVKSVLLGTESKSFLLSVYSVSDFLKNCRRFAYSARFVDRVKSKHSSLPLIGGELSATEIEMAFMRLVWCIQQEAFSEEIDDLEKGKEISGRSMLKKLNPFLEVFPALQLKLLRVGGRLRFAQLPVSARFPVLLPRKNAFVESYVRYLHLKNFHAGPQALVSIIREKFWIINARDYVRKIVRSCMHCFRYRPRLAQQIMGDLPKERVNQAPPFCYSGVDFCGPVLTTHRIRGRAPFKSYIAIFVCFVTKAVHIEVVSDLTSEAFVAALKRFVGRRNLCKHLYCDNATNFIGARRLLQEFRDAFFKQNTQRHILSWCTNNFIEFHPIPPRAPHFGGLWEAAVKSAKGHLFRTLRGSVLTFEELTTVMVQIEGVLNSRPITPLSTDPNDFEALTPFHFLNQAPFNNIVEPPYEIEKLSYIHRWRRVTAINQHFWRRWSKEYLHQLQQRCKWTSKNTEVEPGALVLIHQDDLPAYKWMLGRVVNAIAGPDGNIRVLDIKTPHGSIRRALHKVAPLPKDNQ